MEQDQGGGFKKPNHMEYEIWTNLTKELNFFGFEDYYHHRNDSNIIRWNKT